MRHSIHGASMPASYPTDAGLEGQKKGKKKTWGGNKKVQCEKKGPEEAQKRPPPQQKRSLDAVRPRVPVTLWQTKNADKVPKKGGVHSPRPRLGIPLRVTPPRGWVRPPSPTSVRLPTRASRNRCGRKTKQGEKENKAEEAQENPCRLASQEKGLGKGERTSSSPISTRRIPKTHGAQNGTPRKPPRSGTHGQNGRNRQKRRDTKRRKGTAKQVRVRGCPVTT